MAVKTLTVDVPFTQALAATYQEFVVGGGRNLLMTFDEEVFYHPVGAALDGTAVDATERLKLAAGTYSLRLPGSGSGRHAIVGGQQSPLAEESRFAFAAVTGTPSIWVCVVRENVSK